MMHRVFIAINLPESVRQELASAKGRWPELPAKWAKQENLHLTLVFHGNASDQELEEIKQNAKAIAGKHKPFSLKLSKIVYGPTGKNPKMIWAIGPESKELLMLQKDLSKSLLGDSVPKLETEQDFSLHITLGRLKEFEFSRIDLEERPEINEQIDIEIPVSSVDIMESKLRRSGAEYSVIENCKL
ncbi:MAG: RNA 2',3'-cyclic phosphodiesterase [Candidatus Wildermuthbacteria bacterium]|nr:RNA 2',3'-cyclic phosphodiesterase [Candidatus Wildermuthbacteria bacterium]MBI2013916.1 RNA 2',3'-cyclic phosphodiesterase [Candidatus Colwellbacteria bacterium]